MAEDGTYSLSPVKIQSTHLFKCGVLSLTEDGIWLQNKLKCITIPFLPTHKMLFRSYFMLGSVLSIRFGI